MKVFRVFVGIAGLSLLFSTGVFAEIEGGEPGTSMNPDDNIPSSIQRSTPSGSDEGTGMGESGPGERSGALTDLGKEVPVNEDINALEKNVEKTHGGAAAMAAEELEQKRLENSRKGIAAGSAK
ncbi:MAG: hypothetical protein MRJ96_13595 [Nitrospirales bacterium]|nr:hypothetical protein [Nitrospira sp.]MDR4502478.1 hypothetical protein [Nitrospirales bacterium]